MFSLTFWQLHCKAGHHHHSRAKEPETAGCLLSSWCFELGSAASVVSSNLEQKRQNVGALLADTPCMKLKNGSCSTFLVDAGRGRFQRSTVCTSWKPDPKTCPELLHGLPGTGCISHVGWELAWGFKLFMSLGDCCEQSTVDANQGPNIDEMLKTAQVTWVMSASGHALWVLNTHISFWLQFLWWHASFWGKSCLSPEWQCLCGCEIPQFLSKELLTAHPSWESDPVWCKMSALSPLTPQPSVGQDITIKAWCGLLTTGCSRT